MVSRSHLNSQRPRDLDRACRRRDPSSPAQRVHAQFLVAARVPRWPADRVLVQAPRGRDDAALRDESRRRRAQRADQGGGLGLALWVRNEAGGTKTRLFGLELASGETSELAHSGKHILDFRWAPDSERLAVRASEQATTDHAMMYSSLYTRSVKGEQLDPLTQTEGKLGAMAWSPDGSQLAFLGAVDHHDSTAGTVYLVSAGGGEAKALTPKLEATAQWLGWSDTTYSKRFRAAMIAAAVLDWVSFTGTTEIEHENSLVHWNLWPWDDMSLPWERSPIAHIGESQTASLIVHGAADTRVPTGQSLELYRGLKRLGVTTELLMYPREGHGIAENVHSLHFVNRFLDWFDTYVKDAEPGDQPQPTLEGEPEPKAEPA